MRPYPFLALYLYRNTDSIGEGFDDMQTHPEPPFALFIKTVKNFVEMFDPDPRINDLYGGLIVSNANLTVWMIVFAGIREKIVDDSH